MSIQIERIQSLLKELLIEALSSLCDSRINGITITRVVCSKGKQSAQVFVQLDEQPSQAIKSLRKAEGILKEYVLQNSGWYRCPHLIFVADEELSRTQHLEELFKQIATSKSPESKS